MYSFKMECEATKTVMSMSKPISRKGDVTYNDTWRICWDHHPMGSHPHISGTCFEGSSCKCCFNKRCFMLLNKLYTTRIILIVKTVIFGIVRSTISSFSQCTNSHWTPRTPPVPGEDYGFQRLGGCQLCVQAREERHLGGRVKVDEPGILGIKHQTSSNKFHLGRLRWLSEISWMDQGF